jgi:hypothetical protein
MHSLLILAYLLMSMLTTGQLMFVIAAIIVIAGLAAGGIRRWPP